MARNLFAGAPLFWSLAVVVLGLLGCSSSDDGGGTSGDAAAATQTKRLGESCSTDSDCQSDFCLLSEYAPVGFCSETCETDGAACPDADGEAITAYCVRMPDEFLGPTPQFCVPLCKTKQQCQSLSSTWETCAEPEYKGNPLYPSEVGIFTCQSPSALGKRPLNVGTCEDWRAAYPDFVTQANICAAYCDYLANCAQPPDSADCCAYGCMLSMVVQGELDVLYEKEKKCMVTAYDGFRNTTEWCTAPPEQCNSEWKDTSP